MIAYLDTHVAMWLVQGQVGKLSVAAKAKIQACSLLISPMVVVEFEYLLESGRTTAGALEIAGKLKRELDVEVCGLAFPAVVQASLAEKWTRDPFDRVIVAQARANGGAALISADGRIGQNYRATVWAD